MDKSGKAPEKHVERKKKEQWQPKICLPDSLLFEVMHLFDSITVLDDEEEESCYGGQP